MCNIYYKVKEKKKEIFDNHSENITDFKNNNNGLQI